MAKRNHDRAQPPPNPFFLAPVTTTTTTTTTPTPALLFSQTLGTAESGRGASLTSTASVSFSLPATAPTASTSFIPPVFPAQGQTSRGFLTPTTTTTTTTTSTPSSASLLNPDLSTKNTAAPTPSASSIFGGAHARTTVTPSTLAWGTKSAGDLATPFGGGDPLPSRPAVSSVFGGSAGGLGSGFGAAASLSVPPKVFGGGETASAVFGSGTGGLEAQASLFSQFRVPSAPQTDLIKVRTSEAVTDHQEQDVSVGSRGGTDGVAGKTLPTLFGKADTSSFGSLKGKVDTTRASEEVDAEGVVTSKKKVKGESSSKGQAEGHSSPPDYNKKEVTKIIVTDIPDSCMDKDFLKTHFSKFGKLKRLIPYVQTRQATIIYHTHDAASKAKRKGCKLHPMLPTVKIYYGTPARRRSDDASSSDAAHSKKKAIRTLQQVQASDLDPYTPLQRPGTDPLPTSRKFTKTKVTRPSPKPSPSLPAAQRLSTAKKKVRSKSPAREAKEPSTVVMEEGNLAGTLECVAHNNSDRYAILKARDKLLRRERHRPSDLQEASYLAATCPDMCPELERYMRDVQYDLSATFEMMDSTFDHRLAIKKFSRSSADKELPLPHELRPGPVLLQTMDYLVCNVIGRVDEEGMEADVWYNYLWNRTRAIRNDLMQQQLTSQDAVTIMERCTRFHIYVAARLCEEPPDLYDDKMNTEHLTKSLQTLKELYHDLGEQGCHFDSEPEFRAYEMLLSLNYGEAIVNKYAQYRDEVQKSSPVQFALKVILAVTFNNYVKFFRLVRECATYLQGCLLHRYFRQVRSRALETIVKSYMPPKGTQAIPLPTVIHILGFENDVEGTAYLRCHGITAAGGSVFLERRSFIQAPEELPPPVRPVSLVEVNRKMCVGEVIQGEPIPANPLHSHIPHDSFDAQGRLRPGARDASDQSGARKEVAPEVALAAPVVVQQPVTMQNYELVSHMKDVYSLVEGAVLPHMVRDVVVQVVGDAATQSVAGDLLVEGVQWLVEEVAREGYQEVEREVMEKRRRQREKEERERKAMEEMRQRAGDQLSVEYTGQFLERFLVRICKEAVYEVSEEVALQELAQELPHRCCEEVLVGEIAALCREAIQDLVAEQQHKVEVFMRKLALRRVAEHFHVWQLQTQKAHRRKQSQLTFPAACSGLSLCQQSQALSWGYTRDPEHNMCAPQLARLEDTIRDSLKKLTVQNLLMKECAWHPLALRHQLAAKISRCPPPAQHNLRTQYFKVLVCWEQTVNPLIVLWLRSKLGGQQGGGGAAGGVLSPSVTQPLYNTVTFVSGQSGLEYAWVMREVAADSLADSDLAGTGLLLYVSSEKTTDDSCPRRIRDLLEGLPGTSFFQIRFEGGGEDVRECWSLVEEDLLKPETSERLQSLLLSYWRHQGDQVFVASAPLNDLANNSVATHFLEPALRRHGQRAMDGRSPLPPSALVDLYNSVLDTLMLALADDDLHALSWPPPELAHLPQAPPRTWNAGDATRASRLLAGMKLPAVHVDEAAVTWGSLARVLHRYAASVAAGGGEGPILASHVDNILAQAQVEVEHLVCGDADEDVLTHLEVHPLLAPWIQIIYACASYKLSGLPATTVYYQPKTLLHFPSPTSWVAACRSSDPGWAAAVQQSPSSASRKRKAHLDDRQERKVTKTTTVHSRLLDDIAAEREKCAVFEKSLEDMLDVEEELKMLFNSSY